MISTYVAKILEYLKQPNAYISVYLKIQYRRCGSSSSVPTLQAQGPEFKLQSHQKAQKKPKTNQPKKKKKPNCFDYLFKNHCWAGRVAQHSS
jgi:hypothetical protein